MLQVQDCILCTAQIHCFWQAPDAGGHHKARYVVSTSVPVLLLPAMRPYMLPIGSSLMLSPASLISTLTYLHNGGQLQQHTPYIFNFCWGCLHPSDRQPCVMKKKLHMLSQG